jgi:hypothetical protein
MFVGKGNHLRPVYLTEGYSKHVHLSAPRMSFAWGTMTSGEIGANLTTVIYFFNANSGIIDSQFCYSPYELIAHLL